MIPDRLQYFLKHFWNDQKLTNYGPSDPVFITKILQQIQERYGNVLEIIFHICESEFVIFWEGVRSQLFDFLFVELLSVLEL